MKNNRNNTSAAPRVHSYFENLLTAAIPVSYFLQLIQTYRALVRLQVNPETLRPRPQIQYFLYKMENIEVKYLKICEDLICVTDLAVLCFPCAKY